MGLASLGFVVLGTASLGIAQGREEHLRFSIGFLANGFGRAFVGIVFVLAFRSVIGVSAGLLVGCAVGAVISYLLICPKTWAGTLDRSGAAEFGHIAHALLVLFTLTNVDVLLARIFLTEDQSGEYSVGVLLALGVFVTGFSFAFGAFVMRVLGGAQYVELGSEAWLFALEGSAFALVQVLLYARLAAQDRRAVLTVWVALLVLVGIVAFWRHNSVAEIVTTVVAVSLVLAVVGLLMDRRNSPRGAVVPIEAAE